MNSRHPSRGFILLFSLVVGAIFFAITVSLAGNVTASMRLQRHMNLEAQALALAEAGMEKVIYELNRNPVFPGDLLLEVPLGEGTFMSTVLVVDGDTRRVTATGYIPSRANAVAERTITATVSVDSTLVAFHYGVQVGAGGLQTSNGSTITGSVYSNGPISGGGSITGDAIAAGTSQITGVSVLGTARAHSLSSCTITGTATYTTTDTCSGIHARIPVDEDAPIEPLPISDAQIAEWETTASTTEATIIEGDHIVTGTETLGPAKINGDLTVGNGATLYISGPIWVVGDVSLSNNSFFYTAASAGSQGVVLIADDPADRANKGLVDLSNNITVGGNGTPGSYPLVVSMSSSTNAIVMTNNASSVLLYAPYGRITIGNNASVNQVTGYQVKLNNNSTLAYLAGLQNANFTSGPGAGWAIDKGTYVILP